MDNRKQEAIEILEQERNLLKAGDPDSTVWNAEGWAKHIYDRIAPLIRGEFPREEFEALLLRFQGMDTASAWLNDCQQIWESDHIAEEKVCQHKKLFLFKGNKLPMCADCQQHVEQRSGIARRTYNRRIEGGLGRRILKDRRKA